MKCTTFDDHRQSFMPAIDEKIELNEGMKCSVCGEYQQNLLVFLMISNDPLCQKCIDKQIKKDQV